MLHISLDIGLLFKGIFALGEILLGVAAFFLTPDRMHQLISWITAGELKEDPTDWLMNYLVGFGHSFTIGSQHFAIIYLLSHGILNLTAIIFLWKRLLWAYPYSILVLCGFIVYQMINFVSGHSVLLLVLTAVDMIVIALTLLEYRDLKKRQNEISEIGDASE